MATVSVTPVYRSREERLRAPAKLAATMLEVLAAGAADGARFQRGRAYARDGAVAVLHVSTGSVEAEVMGSRDSGYEVTIHTVLAPGLPEDSTSLMPLVPEADDLRFSCTCPDAAEPCKHAVAALLALAAEVGDRPELLRLWRVGASPRARLGVAKDRAARQADRAPTVDPAVPAWEQPAWHTYLGTADDAPQPVEVRELLPPLPEEAPRLVGNVDAAAIVGTARATLARHVELLRELRRR